MNEVPVKLYIPFNNLFLIICAEMEGKEFLSVTKQSSFHWHIYCSLLKKEKINKEKKNGSDKDMVSQGTF